MNCCTATHLEMPTFTEDNSEVWFYAIESIFRTHGITEDLKKYVYTVSALSASRNSKINEALIALLPKLNKYLWLKSKIINLFPGKSCEKTNINKPSHLLGQLCKLKHLDEMSESSLRNLWIAQLSHQSQYYKILPLLENQNLCLVAKIADKIYYEQTANTSECANIANNKIETLEKKCLELEDKLKLRDDVFKKLYTISQNSSTQELAKKSDNKTKINNTGSSSKCMEFSKKVIAGDQDLFPFVDSTDKKDDVCSHRNDRNRTPLLRNDKKRFSLPDVCAFHRRFREHAKKCIKPCSFRRSKKN